MSKEKLLKARALLEGVLPYPPNEVDVQFKFMFGGMGAFANGRIFAMLLDEEVAFKLPPESLDKAAAAGGKAWVYADSGKEMHMKQYMIFPADIMGDAQTRGEWLRLSIDYALAQPPKKPSGRRRAR